MLAVFDQSVAKAPEGLKVSAISDEISGGRLVDEFGAVHKSAVVVGLGTAGSLAYSADNLNPFIPRLFAVLDGIFCLFQGHFENTSALKQQYGLWKTATEVNIVIEAYRTLRDRGPFPASHVMRDFVGKFAFVLFDSSSNTAFVAADADGNVPFFWGVDSNEHLVLSDDKDIVKKGCGHSFAAFPKGCFFTTSGGLQSFEHPRNELKAMPRVDSQGQVSGATFKVDTAAKKDSSMPRVDSAANWASQY